MAIFRQAPKTGKNRQEAHASYSSTHSRNKPSFQWLPDCSRERDFGTRKARHDLQILSRSGQGESKKGSQAVFEFCLKIS